MQKWLLLFLHELETLFEFGKQMYGSNFDWMNLSFKSPLCQNNNNNLPVFFLFVGKEQSLKSTSYSNTEIIAGEKHINSEM